MSINCTLDKKKKTKPSKAIYSKEGGIKMSVNKIEISYNLYLWNFKPYILQKNINLKSDQKTDKTNHTSLVRNYKPASAYATLYTFT